LTITGADFRHCH